MEFMPDFPVLYPKTVEEAIGFFNNNKDVRYVAGGTDLVVNIRRGIVAPRHPNRSEPDRRHERYRK